jgi:hypothetical protein
MTNTVATPMNAVHGAAELLEIAARADALLALNAAFDRTWIDAWLITTGAGLPGVNYVGAFLEKRDPDFSEVPWLP